MKSHKDKLIHLRCTQEEVERFRAAAERRHLNPSAWMRQVLLDAAEGVMEGKGREG